MTLNAKTLGSDDSRTVAKAKSSERLNYLILKG